MKKSGEFVGFFFVTVQVASGLLGWASGRERFIDPILLPVTVIFCLGIVMPTAPDTLFGGLRRLLTLPDGAFIINWFTLALFILGRMASEITANAGEDAPEREDQSWASFRDKAKQEYAAQEDYFSKQNQSYTRKNKTFNDYTAPPPPQRSELEIHLHTLGLKPGASPRDIKRTYRDLAMKHHPDRAVADGKPDAIVKQAAIRMQEINDAYAWLKTRA